MRKRTYPFAMTLKLMVFSLAAVMVMSGCSRHSAFSINQSKLGYEQAITQNHPVPSQEPVKQVEPNTPVVNPTSTIIMPEQPTAISNIGASKHYFNKFHAAEKLAHNGLKKLAKTGTALAFAGTSLKEHKKMMMDGNLRLGIILLLISLILSLFSGISAIFWVGAVILGVIGLILIVLWLLDQA